jgi:hypothetical protein
MFDKYAIRDVHHRVDVERLVEWYERIISLEQDIEFRHEAERFDEHFAIFRLGHLIQHLFDLQRKFNLSPCHLQIVGGSINH